MVGSKYILIASALLFFLADSLEASPFRKRQSQIWVEDLAHSPLKHRIAPCDKRFISFQRVLDLMNEREVKTIVETGTARNGECNCEGDGCSTPIWGDWAQQHGASVYSVDIDPHAIQSSASACSAYHDCISFVTSDSVEFLASFNKPIDFLYLDSYDFEVSNPEPSQEHHLKEIIAAYPCLHVKSIIMIDDCGQPFGGKGKLVIQYLLDRGWQIALSGYQVILVYE